MDAIEQGMNKSYVEIRKMYDIVKSSIRQYFSRMLMDHDENNRLDCFYPIFRNKEYFGLGELEMPYVDKMYQINDGTIWIHIYGNDEDSWSELDEFDTDDLIDFIQQIENNN